MKRVVIGLIGFLISFILLSSCEYGRKTDSTSWDVFQQSNDSLQLNSLYHYSLNDNFKVKSDSLLLEQLPVKGFFKPIYNGDEVVVAEFLSQPNDSIDTLWVKIARDQETQGWIRQCDLLNGTTPVNYISRFLDNLHELYHPFYIVLSGIIVLIFILVSLKKRQLRLIIINDIDSIYPLCFSLVGAFTAVWYNTIQTFWQNAWLSFYLHPSLNPFEMPMIMGLMVGFVWLLVVLLLAVMEEVFRKLPILNAIYYLVGFLFINLFVYQLFILIPYFMAYILLIVFFLFFIWMAFSKMSWGYLCGNCNRKLRRKGECPHCGAINK